MAYPAGVMKEMIQGEWRISDSLEQLAFTSRNIMKFNMALVEVGNKTILW